MHAIGGAHPLPRRIQDSLAQHVGRAVVALLARLEHEDDVAGQFVAVSRKDPSRPHEHRRVQVVTAGMHDTWFLAGVVKTGRLGQGQSVHVAAQEDRRSGAPPAQHRGH